MKPFDHAVSFVDILRHRAEEEPERRAFLYLQDGITETGELSYADLDRQARSIAAELQSGSPAGGRALLLYPPGLEFVTAFCGCLYAGITAVPVYPPRPNQSLARLQSIAVDSQATIALTTSLQVANLERQAAQNGAFAGLGWLATDSLPGDAYDDWRGVRLDRGSLAFLQYTSGSTGSPKGVIVTHGNLLANSEFLRHSFELTPDSVSVTWLPSFHDMGLVDGVLQPLYTGFPGVAMPPLAFLQNPLRWLQAITRYRSTHCGGPNFGYDLCSRKIGEDQLASLDLSSWLTAYNGAEPVSRDTLERFAARFAPAGFRASCFYPCYGMAEATLIISGGTVGDAPVYFSGDADALENHRVVPATDSSSRIRHVVGCGRTWMDTRVVIVDPVSLEPCGPDRVGEIWVAGASVTQGYWNRPDLAAGSFASPAGSDEGTWFRTGDLGFMRDGELFVTGRIKDVILIRGENHYPQDIEETVQRASPLLRPASGAAFTVEVNGQERLVVVQEVERSALRRLDSGAVAKAVREAVANEHGLSVSVLALIKPASIPKTSSGKIQRRASRQQYLDGTLEWAVIPAYSAAAEKDRSEAVRGSGDILAATSSNRLARPEPTFQTEPREYLHPEE